MAESRMAVAPPDPVAWRALAEMYHRYLTGLLLSLVTRAGPGAAADVVFETFRAHHLEQFLPGLAKLDLDHLPPAVACAQYHVLSNALGGVRVEWIPESDTKSWVRYLPPRWIFDGTAVCGIPTSVSRAMLRGWHGHNGVSLGNDRLGFVCTMQTTDGQPGLEGYYIEEDSPLEEAQRVRFRPGERPVGRTVSLPTPSWDAERLGKVERNYASNYIRTILPAMCRVVGPADAGAIGRIAARQIGMQYHQAIMAMLTDRHDPGPEPSFADRFARLLSGHGSQATVRRHGEVAEVRVDRRPLFEGLHVPTEVFEAWNGLWEGLAAMESLLVTTAARADIGGGYFEWRVTSAGG